MLGQPFYSFVERNNQGSSVQFAATRCYQIATVCTDENEFK